MQRNQTMAVYLQNFNNTLFLFAYKYYHWFLQLKIGSFTF